MDESGPSRLTDLQKDCLRRVFLHQGSKVIARELGVSASAIDKTLERACRALGAANRIDAAIILAKHEGRYASYLTTSDPIAIVPDADSDTIAASTAARFEARGAGLAMRDEPTPFVVDAARSRGWQSFAPLRAQRGGEDNDLPLWVRVISIAAVAVLAMLAASVLLGAMTGFGAATRPG